MEKKDKEKNFEELKQLFNPEDIEKLRKLIDKIYEKDNCFSKTKELIKDVTNKK